MDVKKANAKDFSELVERIGAVSDAATVQRVFGKPHAVGEKTVIPLAEVKMLMGYGFGRGSATDDEASEGEKEQATEDEEVQVAEGEGGGASGAVTVKPLGVFEITEEKTEYIPLQPSATPFVWLLAGVGLGLLLSGCRRKHDG